MSKENDLEKRVEKLEEKDLGTVKITPGKSRGELDFSKTVKHTRINKNTVKVEHPDGSVEYKDV